VSATDPCGQISSHATVWPDNAPADAKTVPSGAMRHWKAKPSGQTWIHTPRPRYCQRPSKADAGASAWVKVEGQLEVASSKASAIDERPESAMASGSDRRSARLNGPLAAWTRLQHVRVRSEADEEQALPSRPRALVAFDLDGTLLRGPTVCELLAEPLGRLAEMRRFEALSAEQEIAAARREMARWYQGRSTTELCEALGAARWAPGAREGVAALQAGGIEVVIASITWSFAVDWVAERLGVARTLGTRLEPGGAVGHVWPRDKARWLERLVAELRVPVERVAAVGDSGSDAELLAVSSLRFFVGAGAPPPLPALEHRPAADIASLAGEILARWAR